jgi:hypothetical protein
MKIHVLELPRWISNLWSPWSTRFESMVHQISLLHLHITHDGQKIVDNFFEPGQTASDRSDVIVRVFHLKLDDLLDDIRSGTIFGPLVVGTTLYTLESFLFFPLNQPIRSFVLPLFAFTKCVTFICL